MAKFSGSTVTPGQVSEGQQELIATAPVQQLQERTPQAQPANLKEFLDTPSELPPGEVAPEDITAGVEAGLAVEEQAASERVPTLRERGQDTSTVHRWQPRVVTPVSPVASTVDGGLKTRATQMAQAFSGPDAIHKLHVTPTRSLAVVRGEVEGDIAEIESAAKPGSLTAALHRSGAVATQYEGDKPVSNVDPLMLSVGSAVTENMFAQSAFGDTEEEIVDIDPTSKAPTVSKGRAGAFLSIECVPHLFEGIT